jgi:hypothetical protein
MSGWCLDELCVYYLFQKRKRQNECLATMTNVWVVLGTLILTS